MSRSHEEPIQRIDKEKEELYLKQVQEIVDRCNTVADYENVDYTECIKTIHGRNLKLFVTLLHRIIAEKFGNDVNLIVPKTIAKKMLQDEIIIQELVIKKKQAHLEKLKESLTKYQEM